MQNYTLGTIQLLGDVHHPVCKNIKINQCYTGGLCLHP